ncbi:MAG: ABC transporter ATP-binding protein [Alphaproteobacteria bacterium]|nr:ABC transporter ATP-binding protein [Alphaproteobacteria bacterium]
MTHLELRGLTKRYDGVAVVDGIDLSVPRGNLVCLLGPSGCGKTTTLRLVAGFVAPNGGEVRVNGQALSSDGYATPPEQRRMSMIFQSYALWPHMTVAANVAYGLTLRGMPKIEAGRRVAEMLGAVKLGAFADRYPGELSGGQQQRAALARALIVEPEILLLDEPLSNLDAALREEMRFEIRRLHDAYRYTTVYVTHDQAEAMTTADLIVVMNQGRIEQAGSAEEVYNRPRSAFVAAFLGGANILSGRAVDAARLDIGPAVLRCAEPSFVPGGEASLSIRYHEVRVHAEGGASDNRLPARVIRQTFLGSLRDLALELADGTMIRASAPPDLVMPPDARVWVDLPSERCRPLPS